MRYDANAVKTPKDIFFLMDDLVRTTVRLDPDLHERVRISIAKRRMRSFQSAVEEALNAWLGGGDGPRSSQIDQKAAPELSEWHRKLTEILKSGDQATIAAVTQNIDVFHDRLRPAPAACRVGGATERASGSTRAAPRQRRGLSSHRLAEAPPACKLLSFPGGLPPCLASYARHGLYECPAGEDPPCAIALGWLLAEW